MAIAIGLEICTSYIILFFMQNDIYIYIFIYMFGQFAEQSWGSQLQVRPHISGCPWRCKQISLDSEIILLGLLDHNPCQLQ